MASTCVNSRRRVKWEKGTGGSSPGCGNVRAKSMLPRRRRGGVPFHAPHAETMLRQAVGHARRGDLARAASLGGAAPHVNRSAQERAGCQDDDRREIRPAGEKLHAGHGAILHEETHRLPLAQVEIGRQLDPVADLLPW